MSYSLNEVEAMARKATRGAGEDWGLAEEAGRAARWLCAQGIDGVAALTDCLAREARDGACPLRLGCDLSDRAAALVSGRRRYKDVASPVLLLPFVAMAARQIALPLWVECDGSHAVTDGQGLAMTSPFPAHAMRVDVLVDGGLSAPLPRQTRARPDPAAWAMLCRFAHKTYAPASEASRLRGAAAGLSDTD